MNRTLCNFCLALAVAGLTIPKDAMSQDEFPATILGAPVERKVEISWNRFNDHAECAKILQKINRAFPSLTRLYSIGKSYEDRDIWCIEVTNHKHGDAKRKPGMYIDGNIHGNEVQGGEVVLYTAWYLCESFGKIEQVDKLLNERVFYLIPSINPDGRDNWFHQANTAHSSRSGYVPRDDDKDGLIDEDPFDDLNGDGSINMMRIRDPNGRWKPHPKYPEFMMTHAEPDEPGEYTYLGEEGIDNDGDGKINEDRPGKYDSNRNWAYDWQPNYVQYGAHDYPFSLPNTKAVADFVMQHPNIAAAQSYHNTGGMILRAPGQQNGAYHPADDQMMQEIAKRGERMLPFYRSLVLWKDLYTVWGGEIDWFYGACGIAMYTNELFTTKNMHRNNDTDGEAQADFLKYLMLGQGIVEWEEYDHPTYGKIEIGGIRKEFPRTPPSFLLEEECHRNMAFTLYHADMMPHIEFGEIEIEPLSPGLAKIWVEIKNNGYMPTRLGHDVNNHISPPDIVSISGNNARVLSAGRVADRYFKKVDPVKVRPNRVEIPSIGGLSSKRVQFIIEGTGSITITADSAKGGVIKTEAALP